MRPPITFVYGNCVFALGPEDCWAAFTIEPSTYEWLSEEGKRARMLELVGALEAIEADIQIIRVSTSGRGPRNHLVMGAPIEEPVVAVDLSELKSGLRGRYVEQQRKRLAQLGSSRPAVFLLVSLREPDRDVASYVSKAASQHPREWWLGVRRALSAQDGRVLAASELERTRVRADQAHARLAEYLPVQPARGVELQWLVRRAFCRGLGEPTVDGLHEPRALVFERNGRALLAPLEGDVMRWGSLVPFSWFFLLALECSFPTSRLLLRTALSGAKRPVSGRKPAKLSLSQLAEKAVRAPPLSAYPRSPRRSQVRGWLEVQEHQEPAHRPLRQPSHQAT
jgi:hypothetical protein